LAVAGCRENVKNVNAPLNLFSFGVKMRPWDFLDFGKTCEKENSCSSLKLSLPQPVVANKTAHFEMRD